MSQGNLVKGVIGIELVRDHQNITVKNGTVKRFTGSAIHAYIPNCDPQPTLKNLTFDNLNIIDNGGDGDPNPSERCTEQAASALTRRFARGPCESS